MDRSDEWFYALVCGAIVGLIGCVIYFNIQSVKQRKEVDYIEREEYNCTLNTLESYSNEIEQLNQQIAMLEEQIEILSFQQEEIYSILESEFYKRTELKDVLTLSEDDLNLLAKLVKREAGGEPFECKVCVCLVVFNRMCDSNFKNTLSEVIYEKGQFSPAEDKLEETVPTADCYFAVKSALNLTYNEINEFYGTDLMFFRRATEEKVWGTNTTYAFTIGKTDFYRLTK